MVLEKDGLALLPSGRIGRRLLVNKSNRPVYVDSHGKRVCMHGERAGTIMGFIQAERGGKEDVRAPSTCDCLNTDGLLSTPASSELGSVPETRGSVFELLVRLDAVEKVVNGRPQRKAVGEGDQEIWIQPAGTLVCSHGNTRKRLIKMKQGSGAVFKCKSMVRCGCTIAPLRRNGSVFSSGVARTISQHTGDGGSDGSGGGE